MTRLPLLLAALGGALALAVPAAAEPEPICVYPYDGGWCTPRISDHEPEPVCIYPYDGGWCSPRLSDLIP